MKSNKSTTFEPSHPTRTQLAVTHVGIAVSDRELIKFIAAAFAWGAAHQMALVIHTYFITQITGSNTPLIILAVSILLALIVMSIVSGALGNRINRKLIIIIGSAASSISMLILGILLITNRIEAWHIEIVAIIQGGALAFEWTARTALLPNMANHHILTRATAFDNMAIYMTRILVPIIWAGTLPFIETYWGYFGLSALFICNLIIVATFKPAATRHTQPRMPMKKEVADFIKILKSNQILSINIIFTFTNAMMIGALVYLIAPFAGETLYIEELFVAITLGGAIGGLTIGIIGSPVRMWYALISTNMLAAASVVFLAIAPFFYLELVFALTFGIFHVIHASIGFVAMQTSVRDENRGLLATAYILAWSGVPIGGFIFAQLSQQATIPEAFITAGFFVATVTIAIAGLSRKLRQLKHRE